MACRSDESVDIHRQTLVLRAALSSRARRRANFYFLANLGDGEVVPEETAELSKGLGQ
ncbi:MULTISPECIES: hypothetical protein [unclassified Chromohalobacter]|uniref:hypothetical protein n=1 Tax=unclassified Chromohalobacter TaxID=2628571 RepID=UPI002468B148|nr:MULTISPECIES: hypothetical protein [unclassified Chromohalobacter]